MMLTGGGHGPSAARQLGVEASTGDAIALLDDDDYWYADKLVAQSHFLQAVRRDGMQGVISARFRIVNTSGKELGIGPRRLLDGREDISDYLFRRREFRWGEAAMPTPSLLIDRDLLRVVPFDKGSIVHEDWDWLLRVSRRSNVRFGMVPEVHLAVCANPRGSGLSRRLDCSQSVLWADKHREFLSPRQHGDFLLSVGVSAAIDSGSWREGLRIALRAFRHGRPGLMATLSAVMLLTLPRGAVDACSRCRVALRRAGQWRAGRTRRAEALPSQIPRGRKLGS